MSRSARCTIPGRLHYVLQAGSRAVFLSEEDCFDYLGSLDRLARREGVAVMGYVLLPDSARLLLAPGSGAGLSRCLQELSRRFVRGFNARHGHAGSVWRGRYCSCPIENAPDLELAVCRYLERLPLEAGMAARPWLYLWSSAAHHAGVRTDAFLAELSAFESLGETLPDRASRWRACLERPVPPGLAKGLELSARRGRPFSCDAPAPGRDRRAPKG